MIKYLTTKFKIYSKILLSTTLLVSSITPNIVQASTNCPCFNANSIEKYCSPWKKLMEFIHINQAKGIHSIRCSEASRASHRQGYIFSISYRNGSRSCHMANMMISKANQYTQISKKQHQSCLREMKTVANKLGAYESH